MMLVSKIKAFFEFAAQDFYLARSKEREQSDKAEGLKVPVLAIVEHGVSPGKCCRENIESTAGLQPRRGDEQAADFAHGLAWPADDLGIDAEEKV